MKKYTQGDEDGLHLQNYRRSKNCQQPKKTATGYGKIDFTYDIRVSAIIRKFIRENKPKEGDTLLPKV
jgi:hypothetical protein